MIFCVPLPTLDVVAAVEDEDTTDEFITGTELTAKALLLDKAAPLEKATTLDAATTDDELSVDVPPQAASNEIDDAKVNNWDKRIINNSMSILFFKSQTQKIKN
ncbi:MAG: hypothetical protein U5M23_06685 [Marinagarivorans sp.]|nr:hypothetical protein [Marinagarivorans sp.]